MNDLRQREKFAKYYGEHVTVVENIVQNRKFSSEYQNKQESTALPSTPLFSAHYQDKQKAHRLDKYQQECRDKGR